MGNLGSGVSRVPNSVSWLASKNPNTPSYTISNVVRICEHVPFSGETAHRVYQIFKKVSDPPTKSSKTRIQMKGGSQVEI